MMSKVGDNAPGMYAKTALTSVAGSYHKIVVARSWARAFEYHHSKYSINLSKNGLS